MVLFWYKLSAYLTYLGEYIAKVLRQGKGVFVPKFGTFTYTGVEEPNRNV